MSEERGWFVSCGACGASLAVVNAGVVRTGGTCPKCADLEDEFPVSDELVSTELDWCRCGQPYEVDRMMLAYLETLVGDEWPRPKPEGVSDDAATLLAYLADSLGWADHGSSVLGAWLTPEGETALANLRAAAD